MKKYLMFVALAAVAVVVLQSKTAFAAVKEDVPEPKVTICHSHQPNPSNGNGGGPVGNPYNQEKVSISAVDGTSNNETGADQGKGDHFSEHKGPLFNNTNQDFWGDIIPPTAAHPEGLNWPEGQAIWENDCNYVVVVKDVCPNIDGVQSELPFGYYFDEQGNCIKGGQGGENPTTPTTPTATTASAVKTLPYTDGSGQTNAFLALGALSSVVGLGVRALRSRFF